MTDAVHTGPADEGGGVHILDDGVNVCQDDCCGEVCGACLEGTAPTQFQVVLAGIADDECAVCDENFNATFILDFVSGSIIQCQWHYTASHPCYEGGGFAIRIYAGAMPPLGNGKLIVAVTQNTAVSGEFEFCTFTKILSSALDCNNLVNYDVPLDTQGAEPCDTSGATCKVTSL